MPPFAVKKSCGNCDSVPPPGLVWKSSKLGFVSPRAAAAPVDITTMLRPPLGIRPVPNCGRIACDFVVGTPVPSARVSVALITPHLLSVSEAVWHSSIALA
jgi:hypothetical protein